MISLRHVAKQFGSGTKALEDIDAEIQPGDFVALLGPSGCGKSTLLRLLSGLEHPSSGEIDWGHNGPPAPGEIGYVFQDPTLLPWADAAENVYLPLRLRGVSRADAMPRVSAILKQMGLAGFEQAKPKSLSGGMKMRVSIARALVSKPSLLLLDEPFAALDEFTRHRLQDDLLALWRENRMTVIFVTHSIYEAAYLASQIIIMTSRPGRIFTTITSDLQDEAQRRNSPAYHATVSQITECFQRSVPA